MSSQTSIDVRPVEPKHRLETILSAWNALGRGDELYLTVDHDPKCMYYTLVVDHGEDAFSFDYLESGPLVWKVRVLRK
jgi:uncharacterized protein (DUF2249 family)